MTPQSIWQGSFTVFGVEMKCHVLDNGQRIIERDSIESFMDALEGGSASSDEGDMEAFLHWQMGYAQ